MKNFWDREEMNLLMEGYKGLFDIDTESKKATPKSGVTQAEINNSYNVFEKRHKQMAEVVMPTNRSESRISGCVSKMYEAMMFSWDPNKTRNSYGFFYRTAYLHGLDCLSGKVDGSSSIFKKRYSSVKRHKFQDNDIPEGIEVSDYARYVAHEELGWHDWTLARDEVNDCWDISHKEYYSPYTSIDAYENLQVQDIGQSSSLASIADNLDWQILSEYIPDVPASKVNREIAYVFLEVLQELIEVHPERIRTKRAFGNLMFEFVRSRMPIKITKARIADVRHIVRQAYRYYREDFIEQDEFVIGNHHGVSFDH